MNLEYVVKENDDGSAVSHILRDRLDISARLLIKLKMNEKILVNNTPVFSNHIVHSGDKVIVKIDFEEGDAIIPQEMNLKILFEDDYLLAINKPPNMVVHPSSYHPDNTLSNGVKFYLNNNKKIRAINRLDKDTSGIVLFAKNEYIQEQMIKEKIIKKEYLALVNGLIEIKKGTIDAPIARKEGSIMEREVNFETGQSAITHYEVLKEFDTNDNLFSLVHLVLDTGRTHQIRVHLAYIGNYILGDTLYGKESKIVNRQALHAWRVSFRHPITKESINIVADNDLFDSYKP